MFIAPEIVVMGVVVVCAIGAALGVLSGSLCSLIFRLNLSGTWKDAFLGAVAVPIGLFLVFITPWPENTVRRSIGGGSQMETTMNAFQHPLIVVFVLAVTFPVAHQLYRRKHLADPRRLPPIPKK